MIQEPIRSEPTRAPEGSPRDTKPRSRSRARKAWRRARRKLGRWAALTIGPALLRAFSRTWKPVLEGEEHLRDVHDDRRGHFMALWHGRMVVPVTRHTGAEYCVLVSTSGDGDISCALLERLGYKVVRGSSRGRGAQALREMLTQLRNGLGIVVTPDGPTGPRHSMNPGLAWMARASGRPVLPCGFVAQRAWHLGSWDRFTIPKPFSRVAFVYAEPVHVGRDGGDGELARATEEIRTRMHQAERRGFELLGVEPDG